MMMRSVQLLVSMLVTLHLNKESLIGQFLPIDEVLLAAAKSDNDDLLVEVLNKGGFDINYADG